MSSNIARFAQDRGVADGSVDDDTGPTVVDAAAGNDVADQGRVDARVTVDDEDSAVARFTEGLLHEQVVLEALDGGDGAGKDFTSTELGELRVAATNVGSDLVGKVSGRYRLGHAHRIVGGVGA